MESQSALDGKHSVPKLEKKGTGSINEMTVQVKGQPQKKKIKLDRSLLKINLSQSTSVSNGVKNEIRPPAEHGGKKKEDGIKLSLKSSNLKNNKKEIKSPLKTSSVKPVVEEDSDNDDSMPLAERAKAKTASSSSQLRSPSYEKIPPSSNGEVAKNQSEHPKVVMKLKKVEHTNDKKPELKHSPAKHSSSSNKSHIKSDSDTTDSSKHRKEGVKKIKAERGSSSSPKVHGIKKLKTERSSSASPKTEGMKKIKAESPLVGSSKHGEIKKLKSDSGSLSSPKTDGTKKVKSESPLVGSSKHGEIKKLKSDGGSLASPKAEGTKVKSESPLVGSSKHGEIKKLKSDSGSLASPKAEGTKVKSESPLVGSSKHGEIKKLKSDGGSLASPKAEGTKVKSESPLVGSSKHGEIKKLKSDGGSSASPKTDGVQKIKSESSLQASPKHGLVKKIKSESSLPVSPKKEEVSKKKEKLSTEDSGDDDDVPLATRVESKKGPRKDKSRSAKKRKSSNDDDDDDDDDDDNKPLAARVESKKSPRKDKSRSAKKRKSSNADDEDSDDDDYDKPLRKRKSNVAVKKEKSKGKGVKKEKDEKKEVKKEPKQKKADEEVWKWWEEEKLPEGIKWLTLGHKGPYFPIPYETLPDSVKFYYDGNHMKLSDKSEEVAGFYGKMLDHDYTTKKIFCDNFFEDWRKEMTDEERKLITDMSKCDFKEIHAYYTQKNEERKNMTKEEKQKIKEKNEEIIQEYGYCIMDGHRERVGNFKIEPPGLFRGRGDHPKQGKLKKRVKAREVTINIGKDATVPSPPEGQHWKAVTHDNKVTWLACWIENIQGSYKYVMLNPTSRIKGEKDWQKYETARKLKGEIEKIRNEYTSDWKCKEMRLRQRGVALYFIDKLALRAGHEKDEDTADTVGCCSLRVEHIKLHPKLENKDYVVEFDFLGKDSIHYHNLVEVEKRVFKNLELFKQGKTDGDDLFDRLSTASLNKYLSELMEGLSAKVFRTYNASMTLQDQLNKLTVEDNVASKVLGYNRANRAVAILCNHQRTAPKTFEQSMSNLQQKIDDKRQLIKDAKKEVKETKSELKSCKSATVEKKYEKKKSTLARLQEQLFKLEVTQTDKEENKEIALGTSKLNYLDPRISIAWCQKNDVPIEKIYNKTQRQKFAWAVDMTEEDFVF